MSAHKDSRAPHRMQRPPEADKSRKRASEHVWHGLRNLNRLRPDWTPTEVLCVVEGHAQNIAVERVWEGLPPLGEEELWGRAIGRAKRIEKSQEVQA